MSKETYFEFDQIDRELLKIKSQLQNQTTGNIYSVGEIEAYRLDLRDVKLKLEKLNDEVAQKSNIKDVCTLIDLKANVDDVDKNIT